jgi:hypothetical protein
VLGVYRRRIRQSFNFVIPALAKMQFFNIEGVPDLFCSLPPGHWYFAHCLVNVVTMCFKKQINSI